MLENFKKQVMENELTQKKELMEISIKDSPYINGNLAKKLLEEIDEFTDQEIMNLIDYGYDKLTSGLLNKISSYHTLLFCNQKFAKCFRVLLESKYPYKLNDVDIVKINVIVCHLITTTDISRAAGEEYSQLFSTVNAPKISKLIGYGLYEIEAKVVAMHRYTSMSDELDCVKAVNRVMINDLPSITEQLAIYIYEVLFDSASALFKGTMLDNVKPDTLTHEQKVIYQNQSLAVLTILNNMPLEHIRQILVDYTNTYNNRIIRNIQPRFSIMSISPSEYTRIYQVLEQLKLEMILVP